MARSIDLLRRERPVRLFFAAHTQSSIGTGAGYVGIVILAYDRLESPWAISLVLLADFLPAMLLGPIFGAAADRWSRRWCAVAGDLARAVAFVGIAVVDSFVATLALALLAGTGTGLFFPAVLAGLPSLVDEPRLPAATSLFGALEDIGHAVGPALAAGILLVTTPETLMAVNGATFLLSSLALSRTRLGGPSHHTARELVPRPSLLAEARAGLRMTVRMPQVRTVLVASAAVILFAGMFNVAELLLAREELGTGAAGFSALVAVFGAGVVAGSLLGGRGGPPSELRRRWTRGLLVVAIGFFASGLATEYVVALLAFATAGLGNGLVLVHERLYLQSSVPRGRLGRVFGVRDALGSWAFAVAFLTAGALLALVGTRMVLLIAGAGVLLIWAASTAVLRASDARAAPVPAGSGAD